MELSLQYRLHFTNKSYLLHVNRGSELIAKMKCKFRYGCVSSKRMRSYKTAKVEAIPERVYAALSVR